MLSRIFSNYVLGKLYEFIYSDKRFLTASFPFFNEGENTVKSLFIYLLLILD